jgi:hypothetical protein
LESPEAVMVDPWAEPPVTRSMGPRLRLIRTRMGELLTLTLDMLLIGVVTLVTCGLAGIAEPTTPMAMGIAIYISCKHFGHLRGEIAALREQVALSAEGPGWRPPRAGVVDRQEARDEWQDASVPDRDTWAAMT